MTNAKTKITLFVTSTSRGIQRAGRFVENIKNNCNMKDDSYIPMLTAINEAMYNAVEHGNKKDPRKQVCLKVAYDKYRCEYTIEDEGDGFAHRYVKDPTLPENILRERGRGIFIMKHFASAVEFMKNGRCVRLAFDFGGVC
ncbi:MAG: ATP-binding protein [Bacteroidota bacterium]